MAASSEAKGVREGSRVTEGEEGEGEGGGEGESEKDEKEPTEEFCIDLENSLVCFFTIISQPLHLHSYNN